MSTRRATAAIALGIMLASGMPGTAEEQAPPIRQKLAGQTVILSTSIGEIPISYHADGSLSGNVTTMQAMAAGPKADRGRWWVKADRLCQKWRKWLDGERHCFRVRISGKTIHWVHDDGRKGTARIASH